MLVRRILLASALVAPVVPAQTPPPVATVQTAASTVSLGEPVRTAKLEGDDSDIVYQNGFFLNADPHGHVIIRNKDGRITGDFNLRPQTPAMVSKSVHDVAVFKDGSIVASWFYMLPHDDRRYFVLVHYDPAGHLLEQMDLGRWRAMRICVADDKSIWTLSEEEELGRPVYSPDEGVLRNYKFGTGLVRAVVPRSNFQPDNNSRFPSHYGVHAAIDCSGDQIHVLTDDGKWIEYTLGADFTIIPIEPFSHSTFSDFWQMIGFAYLDGGHACAVIHSVSGNPFRRMLAELLPSADGKTLRWVEVPPDKALPADNQSPNPAHPADQPKELIAVTGILGADHEDGEQLIYRTSKDETIFWSKPIFDGSIHSVPSPN